MTPSAINSAHIAPFLRQIESQASLLHHIWITFPIFYDHRHDRAKVHESHIQNLELIQDTCTSITTLELSIPLGYANYVFGDSSIVAQALDMLDTRFKAILSLKEIIVNIQVYDRHDLSDNLTQKVRNYGWTVEVTELPEKVWFCDEGRFEFDNEEDYNAYMDEKPLSDLQKEEDGDGDEDGERNIIAGDVTFIG